jgi:hypothetical protein
MERFLDGACEVLRGRKLAVKPGSIITELMVYKNKVTPELDARVEELSTGIASDLMRFKNDYINAMGEIERNVLNSVASEISSIGVEVEDMYEVNIPDFVRSYVSSEILEPGKVSPHTSLTGIVAHLPPVDGLASIVTIGSGELKDNIVKFIEGVGEQKLKNVHKACLSNVSYDNSAIADILSCRINRHTAPHFENLLVLFLLTNAIIRMDSFGNVPSSSYKVAIDSLRREVIRIININLGIYEEAVNNNVVVLDALKGLVVLPRNLEKGLTKEDFSIEAVYAIRLGNSTRSDSSAGKDSWTYSELKDANHSLEMQWDEHYSKKILEKRTKLTRTMSYVLADELSNYIGTMDAAETDKVAFRKEMINFLDTTGIISEDNISDVVRYVFITILYKNTGLAYFTNKIKMYKSKAFGYSMDRAITLAIGDIVVEIIANDITVQ